jgi:hypothetical protein
MAVRSKFCGGMTAGIAGLNPVEGMDVRVLCFVVCRVGSGLCDELITHSGQSYRECVCVCVCVCACVCARALLWVM